jgi:hypothetical protein
MRITSCYDEVLLRRHWVATANFLSVNPSFCGQHDRIDNITVAAGDGQVPNSRYDNHVGADFQPKQIAKIADFTLLHGVEGQRRRIVRSHYARRLP